MEATRDNPWKGMSSRAAPASTRDSLLPALHPARVRQRTCTVVVERSSRAMTGALKRRGRSALELSCEPLGEAPEVDGTEAVVAAVQTKVRSASTPRRGSRPSRAPVLHFWC